MTTTFLVPKTRPRALSVSVCLLALLGVTALRVQADPESEARRILDMTGTRGGLVVHLGCGDGTLTAALRKDDRFLVHGLDPDPGNVRTARAHVRATGRYGPVTVDRLRGARLPYTENLVNLVVSEMSGSVPVGELLRVLVPNGVAYVRRGLDWEKHLKPWPDAIDEWGHFLHGPDNNAVARDRTVDIPRSIQWRAGPRWGRSHEELASLSAAVTADGRMFYIVDEAPLVSIRFTGNWSLVARDAFNGVLLWRRPISLWTDHLRHFRSGPVHLPRRLVAVGDAVYATLSLSGQVVQLDGATGSTRTEYAGTEGTEEIIANDGVLYLVVGTSESNRRGRGLHGRREPDPSTARCVMAVGADSGRVHWRKDMTEEGILPLTLAATPDRVYFQSTSAVVCLDAGSGDAMWRVPRPTPARRMGFSAPTLVVTPGVVLSADRDPGNTAASRPSTGQIEWGVNGWSETGFARKGPCSLRAYDAKTGEELWSTACGEGYNSPVDVFVVDSVVWVGPDYRGLDLRTGRLVKRINTKAPRVGMAHHRCYRNKASERFIFTGKSGIEVLSFEKGWLSNNSWVRGTCQYGIIPANGLLYAPPDACACFLTVKAPGFIALAPRKGSSGHLPFPAEPVIRRGPSYDRDESERSNEPGGNDWPMYRHDVRRSGAASSALPRFPTRSWSTTVGGHLTQPAVVGGRVFVASVDTHTVHALATTDGLEIWRFTAGGRIDSTPTVHNGRVIFGSADGWVYSIDAAQGRLVWRFRAAPEDRLVVVDGGLESTWPVHGSPLLQNGSLYVMAGRSSYLNGGLVLYRLDPATGAQLSRSMVSHIDPDTDAQRVPEARFNMEGTTTDILSGDGEHVFLKYFTFDKEANRVPTAKPRLFSIAGFLGEEWFVRSYWIIGTDAAAGWGGWANAANVYPSGRILCFDKERVYGYGRQRIAGGRAGHRAEAYHLFAMQETGDVLQVNRRGVTETKKNKPRPVWADTGSHVVRGMVLGSDGYLATAGPLDLAEKAPGVLAYQDDAAALAGMRGSDGVRLRIVRCLDGQRLSECALDAMPVFDGMAAASGRLFISMQDGSLQCFSGGEGTPLPESASATVLRGEAYEPAAPIADPAVSSSPSPKVTGPDRTRDFAHVEAALVTTSELGHRLVAEKGGAAFAVRELAVPLTGKVVLSGRVRPAPGFGRPWFYENAYLAFGNGPKDGNLVKCGVKFIISKAVIITGPARGSDTTATSLPTLSTAAVDIQVTVDLPARTVKLVIGNATAEAPLGRPLQSITHIGYCTNNAVSDFGPVEVGVP